MTLEGAAEDVFGGGEGEGAFSAGSERGGKQRWHSVQAMPSPVFTLPEPRHSGQSGRGVRGVEGVGFGGAGDDGFVAATATDTIARNVSPASSAGDFQHPPDKSIVESRTIFKCMMGSRIQTCCGL